MASDKSEVDDSIINFDPLINEVIDGRFRMDLPPAFQMIEDHPRNLDESRRPAKKVKEGDERKRVVQKDPIKGFMMQPGENWSQDFCGKCIDERPRWKKHLHNVSQMVDPRLLLQRLPKRS